MEMPYSLRGSILPSHPFKGTDEFFTIESFAIAVKDSILEIGFADAAEADRARKIVSTYLDAHSFSTGIRFTIDLNQSWERRTDGTKLIAMTLSDTASSMTDNVQMATVSATISGKARIVSPDFDSRHLANQTPLVAKAEKYPALGSALKYFSTEVVDDDRPLYGIHKAIEELVSALGSGSAGRAKLGTLVGQGKTFVDEVMQTAQTERHFSRYKAHRVLTDQECRHRAKLMIEAYAKTLGA